MIHMARPAHPGRFIRTEILEPLGLSVTRAAAILGVLLGGFAALRRGRPDDGIVSAIGLALNSMPNFWVALILIIVFGVWLGWFPLSGMSSLRVPDHPVGRALDRVGRWDHLV